MKPKAQVEFGDFQTPLGLAREVCQLLARLGIPASTVVEPTCGVGAFLLAAAESFPGARLMGWDINPEHSERTMESLKGAGHSGRATVQAADFFSQDWNSVMAREPGPILILGNPPWVTNSGISAIEGTNLPRKSNRAGLRGIEALTGKSNFDISEWMLGRLLGALGGRMGTIAMLCKTATARRFLRQAWRGGPPLGPVSIYRVDAKAHFGVAVDACLLVASVGVPGDPEAPVFDRLADTIPSSTMGLQGGHLVPDLPSYRRLRQFEGACPHSWRSGIKHDCSPIMELHVGDDGALRNQLGETVDIEHTRVFPLLKCSDLAHGRSAPVRRVLVPQNRVGEDTRQLAHLAPRTWKYLLSHQALLNARKSSIYGDQPPFSVFGVGDYSFAPWKVAVSGMHPVPRFVTVGPVQDRPVLLDDTSYFLSFADEPAALLVSAILNSRPCLEFLNSLVFRDAKRPITADILSRLNLDALATAAGFADAWGKLGTSKDGSPRQSELALGLG
ncbi:MAG: Modification methylase [Verrucomicrobiota bacterium]|jgi:hypothetical protein